MAINASRPVASSSYAALVAHPNSAGDPGDYGNIRALIKNVTATAGVYVGGSQDPAGERFLWEANDGVLEIELEPGEAIYAVSAGADQTIHILLAGR